MDPPRHCFVGGAADVPAFSVDSSSVDVLYSTLGGAFDAPALTCATPMSVEVRNSIIVSRAVSSDINCAAADISYSATEILVAGTGNAAVGSFDMADATAWFGDYNGGDFSLAPGAGNTGAATFAGIAQWRAADLAAVPPRPADDPSVDIDGGLRPNVDGTADVAGADVP